MRNKISGFTLIEMSIVLIVISLILGGVLKTVAVQREQLKRDETRQQLETIKQALIGFAATRDRLPCPDTDIISDGLENPQNPANTISCTSDEGFLPYADIGVGQQDAWGNRFRYRVTGTYVAGPPERISFADQVAAGESSSFGMTDAGDISIVDRSGNAVATGVPAVVISYAENGRQTIGNIPCAAGVPSATEDENCNNDSTFIADVYLTDYDDLVMWVPLTVLKNRMIEAGKLGL